MAGSLRSWITRWMGTGLAALLVVSACAPAASPAASSDAAAPPAASSDAATPKQGGTLTIVQPAEPFSFNSRVDPKMEGIEVVMNVQDPLINFDPATGKLVPSLAESWKVSPDGKEYEFALRKGVKFSDGTPFDAEDVIFTFDFLTGKREGGAYAGQFKPFIESVTAPDPYTVVVKMAHPWTDFPDLLARLWACRVLSKESVEKAGKDYGATTAVGTGPFMIKEWISGDHHTIIRNPTYWGRPAYLDEVVFRRVPDGTARLIEAKSGQADVVYQPPLDQLDQATSDPKLNVSVVEGNPIVFVRFNTTSPPFNDLNVRQAVFYALDRDQLRKTAYGEYATTATDFLPPWHWAHDANYGGIQTNVEKAKAALAAAGYGPNNPLTFNLTMNNESEYTQLGTLVQAQLKAVGIQADLKPLDPAALNELETKKPEEYNASLARFLLPSGVTDDYIFKMYGSTGPLNRIYLNQEGGLQMPDIEKLINDARVAPDRDASKKLYRQVVDQLVANAVTIPIAFKKNVDLINKRVHNLYVQGTDAELLVDVWVE